MEEWALLPLPTAGNKNTGAARAAGLETASDAAEDARADTDDDESTLASVFFCSSLANETRPGSSSIANACRAKKCAAHASTLSPRALTGGWQIMADGGQS